MVDFFEKVINVQVQISNFYTTFMSNYYVKITSTSNKFSFDTTISSNQVNLNVGYVLKKVQAAKFLEKNKNVHR